MQLVEKPTKPTVKKVTMYAKSNVNVRSGANASHSKVGNLVKGQEVDFVSEVNYSYKRKYSVREKPSE